MVTIRISEISGTADTTEQGFLVWAALESALASSDVVVVSFAGVSTATSSFVNVSFVRLLDVLSYDDIKRRFRIVQSTRQINEMIKTRVQRELLQLA